MADPMDHSSPAGRKAAKAYTNILEEAAQKGEIQYGPKHPKFRPSGERGFHHSDIHKAAEELRMEGKGSEDPCYSNSKKNK